jgi:hypothetical protein
MVFSGWDMSFALAIVWADRADICTAGCTAGAAVRDGPGAGTLVDDLSPGCTTVHTHDVRR